MPIYTAVFFFNQAKMCKTSESGERGKKSMSGQVEFLFLAPSGERCFSGIKMSFCVPASIEELIKK